MKHRNSSQIEYERNRLVAPMPQPVRRTANAGMVCANGERLKASKAEPMLGISMFLGGLSGSPMRAGYSPVKGHDKAKAQTPFCGKPAPPDTGVGPAV